MKTDSTENINVCEICTICEETQSKLIRRLQGICGEFHIDLLTHNSIDELNESQTQAKLFIVHFREKLEISDLCQQIKDFLEARSESNSDGFHLVCITQQNIAKDRIQALRDLGLTYILQETEVFETSRLEFICTQLVQAQYIAIKDVDLIADKDLKFSLYHLMPLRKKFLKIAKPGQTLDQVKIDKLAKVSEFYVHRSDLKNFKNYCQEGDLDSREGQLRYCRAQFLEFFAAYTDLVSKMSDQSETLSFEEGKTLLTDTQYLVSDLAETLLSFGIDDVWTIVNNSAIGDFGSIERTTAVAAYASYFNCKLEYDHLEDLILATLLTKVGIIYLPPQITSQLRKNQADALTDESLSLYRNYPLKSIEMILSRRLPIEQEVKDLILKCNERADGSGFPTKAKSEQLTKQSQLLGFSFLFDDTTLVRMSKERKNQKGELEKLIEREILAQNRFNNDFLADLKRVLLPPSQ